MVKPESCISGNPPSIPEIYQVECIGDEAVVCLDVTGALLLMRYVRELKTWAESAAIKCR